MKRKNIIIALIVLLSIGFAAVSTTLFINGTIMFGTNDDDFDVYFSKAIIDGVEDNTVISSNGKTITYETGILEVVGDKSILEYTVTNNSSQYDAEVVMTCELEENEYVIIDNTLQEEIIEAKSEKSGTLTVELIKTSVNEIELEVNCTIEASAKERDTRVDDPIVEGESSTYSLYGYLVDENEEVIPNTAVVMYSNPVYGIIDGNGYIYLEGIEKGSHTIYLIENKTIEEIQGLSKEEIETNAITSVGITTNTINIVFPNGYKIIDSVIEKTKTVTVSFDANGVDTEIEDRTYTIGKDLVYGALPEITREGYTFEGWYTASSEGTQVTESTTLSNKSNHTLYARWSYILTLDANGGETDNNTIKVVLGDKYPEVGEPIHQDEGFIFSGWYTDIHQGTKVDLNEVAEEIGVTTLYARWTCQNGDVCVVSGTGGNIGDMLQIGNERFYVTNNDGTDVKMFSEFNLYVGGEYDGVTFTTYENPTGIQDSTLIGYTSSGGFPFNGVTAFSSDEQKGENYSDYSGSIVEGYVNNYSNYLRNSLSVENAATLITKEELEVIVGDTLVRASNLSTLGAPAWLYGTSYFTRSVYSVDTVWHVDSRGFFSTHSCVNSYELGVRPLVTVSVDLV